MRHSPRSSPQSDPTVSAQDASDAPRRGTSTFLLGSALALVFMAAAVIVTWPLASQLDEGIPLGTENVATVPLFNLWTMAWNVESVDRAYDGYWQAPIFHPAGDTFAYSEPQPVFGFLAWLLDWTGGSVLVAYNLLLIAALAINGLLATAFLRRVGLTWLSAVAGGGMVLLLPFTHQELGVIQLVPLAGVLSFAMAVVAFASHPTWRVGLALGGSLALAYGLSAQVAVFAALVTVPAALWLWWPHRLSRRAWGSLAVGVVLFLTLTSPLVLAQTRATGEGDFARSADTMRKHSARPSHYLKSPWPQLLPTPGITGAERSSTRAFWPGTLKVLLALGAVAMAWRSPRWRRPVVGAVLVLGTAVLLSVGAHLEIGPLVMADVMGRIPGIAQIRSFFRFALLAQLMVAGLAAGALHGLGDLLGRRIGSRRAAALVGVLALLAVLEMRPAMGSIQSLPDLETELPWLSWIETSTQPDDVLAFLPFPRGRGVTDYLGTSQWMYWQLRHGRPMVNGYSGFFPPTFKRLKEAMATFPSPDALSALDEAGVQYCIVPRAVIQSSPPPDPGAAVQIEMVYRDDTHDLAVFALRRGTSGGS